MNGYEMTRRAIGVFFAGLLLGVAAGADEVRKEGAVPGEWTMDYAAAKALAAEKKLPLLLNFTGSDWCHWCILMDEKVFSGEAWKDYAEEHAVLVTLDFPRDRSGMTEAMQARNEALQAEFGVRGYPTFVVLDSDAKTELGRLGAGEKKTAESFAKEFDAVARLSEARVEAYVKANPEKAEAFRAALAERKEARAAFDAWAETGPERNAENDKIYEGYMKRIRAAEKAARAFN